MTDDRTLERAARSWLEEGPTSAPDRAVDAALSRIQSTHQERAIVPWRFPQMARTARLAGAAVALVAVVAVGLYVLRPAASVGPPPSTPSPPPSQSSEIRSPSPAATAIVLSRTFTSTRHGIQLAYPAGWAVAAATAPWPAGAEAPGPPSDQLDVFSDPSGTQRLVIVSQPLGDTTPQAWLSAYAKSAPQMPPACWPAPEAMEHGTISGTEAWIHGGIGGCRFTEAIVFAGGRVYEVSGYVDSVADAFDRPLFDAFLATIRLDPAAADDTPAS